MSTIDEILETVNNSGESSNDDLRGLFVSGAELSEIKKIHGVARAGIYSEKGIVSSIMAGTENKEYVNVDMYLDADGKWTDVFGKEVTTMNSDIKAKIDSLAKKGTKIVFVYSGDKTKYGMPHPRNKELKELVGNPKRIKCQMFLKKKSEKKAISLVPSKYTFVGLLQLLHCETLNINVPNFGNVSQDIFYFAE